MSPQFVDFNADGKLDIAELAELDKQAGALMKVLTAGTEGLDEEAAKAKRTEVLATQKDERVVMGKKRTAVQDELDPLVPGDKRVSYVWLYENVSTGSRQPAAPFDGR